MIVVSRMFRKNSQTTATASSEPRMRLPLISSSASATAVDWSRSSVILSASSRGARDRCWLTVHSHPTWSEPRAWSLAAGGGPERGAAPGPRRRCWRRANRDDEADALPAVDPGDRLPVGGAESDVGDFLQKEGALVGGDGTGPPPSGPVRYSDPRRGLSASVDPTSGVRRMSSRLRNSPPARTENSRSSPWSVPAGTARLPARSEATTSLRESAAASSFTGSTAT